MRLKYQSLIALGISTIIFGGCTSSGGFLNLGVADAFRKSQANIFKKRLTYSKTPIGNTGLSLPTFGAQSALDSGVAEFGGYPTQHNVPSAAQVAPATPTESVGCGCGDDTVLSNEQFHSPQQHFAEHNVSNAVTTEVITPPIDTVSNSLPQANDLPEVNPLPSGNSNSETKANGNNNFEELDTEGTLEPLGLNKEDVEEKFEVNNQEEIADDQSDKDQSIFEQAELSKRPQMKLDLPTGSSPNGGATKLDKPRMLTLHARPAQSHNVFDRSAKTKKMLNTVHASHKPYYRQQNALRQKPTKLNDRGYRQARNTSDEIQFKPLPPVSETPPAEVLTPTTKMAPLQESEINFGKQNKNTREGKTRTASAPGQDKTVKMTPRMPILRATTVSTASISSLKNLANVIDDQQNQKRFYEANRRTAQGKTSTSIDVLNSGEATVER